MSKLRIRRPEPLPARGEAARQKLRRQAAWAAGTEQFQYRDPLYHVTEAFQQTFDAVGRKHAAALAEGETAGTAEEEAGRENSPSGRGPEAENTSTRPFYEPRPEDRALFMRFSETAFQRGTLSGAVVRGTGQMMLFSCLKKTVGQSQPDKWQQRKLFETGAVQRNLPGRMPSRVYFNRGFTYGAVGLVVDALRDARRTVDTMRDMALGAMGLEGSGGETLRAMYPFLDDSRERSLLEQYREQQKSAGPEAGAALQNAIVRMEALVAKKARIKEEFVQKLRLLSDRAVEAQALFEAPEFSAVLDAALRRAVGAEEPPGGGEGVPDGTAGRAEGPPDGGAPEGAEPSRPPAGTEGPDPGGDRRPGAAGGGNAGEAAPPEPDGAGGTDGQQRSGGAAPGPGATA